MLSHETQSQLAQLLMHIADQERQVEITRQVLCELIDFEPYSVFRTLDRFSTGAITSRLLHDFLFSRGIECTSTEVACIIKQYDSDNDGRLSLYEFQNLVLPASNPSRRDIVLTRPRSEATTEEVLYAFTRLMEREVLYHRDINAYRLELTRQRDFNTMEAFKSIDCEGKSKVNAEMIRRFLVKCGWSPFEEDVDAIIRRIDADGDQELSYLELLEAIAPTHCPPAPYQPSPNRRASPLRQTVTLQTSSPIKRSYSPLKNSHFRQNSPEKAKVADKMYLTPEKTRTQTSLHYKTNASANFPRSSKLTYSPLPVQHQQELLDTLKQQIEILRDLEAAKEELTSMPDFTLIDSFRILDIENKGFVTASDLETSLRVLGIRPLPDESYLLIRSYSKMSDSRLRFSDFSDMMTPKNERSSRSLDRREPCRYELTDPREAFESETLHKYAQVLRLVLDCEALSERLRQRLNRHDFNSYDAFQVIDQDKNGYITLEEFSQFFDCCNYKVSTRDLKCLMERYDKNRDGRVAYSEFVQEITPKSTRRY